nr:hypothetical protein [Flavobacteriaceae bacterium]
FDEKKISQIELTPRAIIPNDSKLFSQADLDTTITHFVTSDSRSVKTVEMLKKGTTPKFEVLDINIPYNETFGILF